MSSGADRPGDVVLPPEWSRLERAAGGAAAAVALWRSRALEAEGEVARLRGALEEVTRRSDPAAPDGEELRRLRAENALLLSRITEARRRVSALLARVAVVEARR